MKKFVVGALMFSWGIICVLVLTVLAGLNPCIYNGIDGLEGALLNMGLTTTYVIFSILTMIGIIICFYEAYDEKIKILCKKLLSFIFK